MTETDIERKVARMVDHLERLLLSRQMSQDDYNKALADLKTWADGLRKNLR